MNIFKSYINIIIRSLVLIRINNIIIKVLQIVQETSDIISPFTDSFLFHNKLQTDELNIFKKREY